jgi:KEOPS complex subunit Cgi121
MATPDQSYEMRTGIFEVENCDLFLLALRKIAQDNNTTIICFDADRLAGRKHANAAIRHALRSFHAGAPIANTLEMEALLYASGSRQCSVATAFGIHTGINRAYVCCCPPVQTIWDALAPIVHWVIENWEDINPVRRRRLKTLFSISDEEIAATGESRFADLILERVALLAVYR